MEDDLRPPRRELPATVRAARLHDDRAPLRAARDRQRATRPDPTPAVVGVVHLRGIGQRPGLLVADESVGVPAVPKRKASLEHLIRAVVTLLTRGQFIQPGIPRLEVGRGRHDVPGDAALAHHVQRPEPAREVVSRVEARGQGGAKSQMPGRIRHDRQHDRGVQEADLAAAPHISVEAAAVQVIQPK
jgi:hypothetical protein